MQVEGGILQTKKKIYNKHAFNEKESKAKHGGRKLR